MLTRLRFSSREKMNSSAPAFPYTVASAMIHPAVESGTRSGSVTFKMTPKTASPIRHPVPSSGDRSSQCCMVQPNTDICRVDQDSTVPKHPQLPRRKIEVLFRQRNKDRKYPRECRPVADPVRQSQPSGAPFARRRETRVHLPTFHHVMSHQHRSNIQSGGIFQSLKIRINDKSHKYILFFENPAASTVNATP